MRGHLSTRRAAWAAMLLLFAACGLAAAARSTPKAVALRATTAIERYPVGAEGVLAWTNGPRGRRLQVHAYVQVGDAAPIRLDRGSRGYTGGIDLPRVAYQEVRQGSSDVFAYDVRTKRRASIQGVNTADWEFMPSISGRRVLFGRDDLETNREEVVVRDTGRRSETVVATIERTSRRFLHPNQVNGPYAVWTRCVDGRCAVFRRDLDRRLTVRLPSARGSSLYAAAVTSDGTVYAARSTAGACGGVTLRRFGRRDPRGGRFLARLPPFTDTGSTFAQENRDGSVDLLYERAPCGTGRFDVYALRNVG